MEHLAAVQRCGALTPVEMGEALVAPVVVPEIGALASETWIFPAGVRPASSSGVVAPLQVALAAAVEVL